MKISSKYYDVYRIFKIVNNSENLTLIECTIKSSFKKKKKISKVSAIKLFCSYGFFKYFKSEIQFL